MKKKKILILENIHEDGINILKKKFHVTKKFEINQKKQLELIKKFDVIVIKSTIQVDKKFIDHATKLAIIARAGTGLDNVDIRYCKKKKNKSYKYPLFKFARCC